MLKLSVSKMESQFQGTVLSGFNPKTFIFKFAFYIGATGSYRCMSEIGF